MDISFCHFRHFDLPIIIEWRKIVLIDKFDIVGTWQGDLLCSERLKQAIEENGITGFEFFNIDYEVVAE